MPNRYTSFSTIDEHCRDDPRSPILGIDCIVTCDIDGNRLRRIDAGIKLEEDAEPLTSPDSLHPLSTFKVIGRQKTKALNQPVIEFIDREAVLPAALSVSPDESRPHTAPPFDATEPLGCDLASTLPTHVEPHPGESGALPASYR